MIALLQNKYRTQTVNTIVPATIAARPTNKQHYTNMIDNLLLAALPILGIALALTVL